MARTSIGSCNSSILKPSATNTPLQDQSTPLRHGTPGTNYLRQRLEQQWRQKLENGDSFSSKTSPTLDKLRMTPGTCVCMNDSMSGRGLSGRCIKQTTKRTKSRKNTHIYIYIYIYIFLMLLQSFHQCEIATSTFLLLV